MSIELPVPRTAVPFGIVDPVEKARAELKAALSAIEEKSNVPKRVSHAAERGIADAKQFAERNAPAATAIAVGVAAAIGLAVWGIVRAVAR